MKTSLYNIYKMYTVVWHLSSRLGETKQTRFLLIVSAVWKSISDLGGFGSLLCLQQLLDILNALLGGQADDVIQRFHVDQHLHHLSDQVPDGRWRTLEPTPRAGTTCARVHVFSLLGGAPLQVGGAQTAAV